MDFPTKLDFRLHSIRLHPTHPPTMASLAARLVLGGAPVRASMAAPLGFCGRKGSMMRTTTRLRAVACASSLEEIMRPMSSSGDGAAIVRQQCGLMVRGKERRRLEEDVSAEFDIWIRDSITEIVREIEEAPFVVHVYGGEGGQGLGFVMEKVESEEEWRKVRRRWEGGRCDAPEGIMLVQLLHSGGEGVDGGNCWLQRSSTKLWGILIQGRRDECSACCLLKTCSVGFCTHFSVKRVQSFTDDTVTQLTNFWL